jgi:hypothetical protein
LTFQVVVRWTAAGIGTALKELVQEKMNGHKVGAKEAERPSGLDLRIAFGRVRDEAPKVTRSKQEPFVYGSLGGTEIALVPTRATEQIGSATPPKVDRRLRQGNGDHFLDLPLVRTPATAGAAIA